MYFEFGKRVACALMVVGVASGLAACGSSAHEKPTTDQIEKALLKDMDSVPSAKQLPETSKEQLAKCSAPKLHDQLSVEALQAIINHDSAKSVPQEQQQKGAQIVSECLLQMQK